MMRSRTLTQQQIAKAEKRATKQRIQRRQARRNTIRTILPHNPNESGRTSHTIEREYKVLRTTLKHPRKSKRLPRLLEEFKEALRREGTPEHVIEIDVDCLTKPRTIEYA